MKYKKLKIILPAAMVMTLFAPGSALAAPNSTEAAEELIIEEVAEESEQTETEDESAIEVLLDEEESEVTEEAEEEVISDEQTVDPPVAESNFRFMKVEKEYALSRKKGLSIYEEKDENSIVIGDIVKNGILYILSEEEDGWVYVESGKVRGFVKEEDLITGDSAERYINKKGEENLEVAEELIGTVDNEALTYKKTTVYDTVEKKRYAIALQKLEILDGIPEESETDSDEDESENEDDITLEDETEEISVVGTLEEGGVCYILADSGEEWVYVESGDVRGFVDADLLMRGHEAKVYVNEKGEENLEEAEEIISPEENKACYYTITSVKEASVSGLIRSAMISYAEQFLGNPYVWGGTSLTDGADCSGFVQSIYEEFGYSIPRVAEDQALYGTRIAVEDAEPGDLIFYARNGEIYHVVMSLGDGRTIEAQGSASGIIYGTVNYDNAVWATRIISDEDTDILENLKSEGKADVYYTEYASSGYTYGEYLGNFKLTSYCACSVCCGMWAGGGTASGTIPTEGRTVAMAGLPFGTKLIINGLVYTVEDRGTPYGHIDIYKNSHQDALDFGVQYADVYLAE